MEWQKLPKREEILGDKGILRKTVQRLLFRYGSLNASMISTMLGMETEPVLAAIKEILKNKRIRIDHKQAGLSAQTPEERIRYVLA